MFKRFIFSFLLVQIFVNGSLASEVPFFDSFNYSFNENTGKMYLSKGTNKNAPLLLFIQGSGCDQVITESQNGVSTTIYDLFRIAGAGKFSVLVVEKLNSGAIEPNRGSDVQNFCGKSFHETFTLDSWANHLNAALNKAIVELENKPNGLVVFGLSEGATVAPRLSALNDKITHVVLSGGSGTTQFFDFVLSSYSDCFDRTDCLASNYESLKLILNEPQSHEKFMWGHPYKRWASFFKSNPLHELQLNKPKVYMVFGTNDKATPVISQELLAAQLKSGGNIDITIRRLPNHDHSLLPLGSYDYTNLGKEIDLALSWAEKDLRSNF